MMLAKPTKIKLMNRENTKTKWVKFHELSELVPAATGIPIQQLAELPVCIQIKFQNSKVYEQFTRLQKIAFPGYFNTPSAS
jgi:hypothetical protein